jgi:hypothetical protein
MAHVLAQVLQRLATLRAATSMEFAPAALGMSRMPMDIAGAKGTIAHGRLRLQCKAIPRYANRRMVHTKERQMVCATAALPDIAVILGLGTAI